MRRSGCAAYKARDRRAGRFSLQRTPRVDGSSVPAQNKGGAWHYVKRLFSFDLLKVLILLSFVLLIIGIIVWLFERKKNPEQFGGTAMHGIGSGFWWSAVTMTTAPRGFTRDRLIGATRN